MRRKNESFGKTEHLCGVKTIDNLFNNGKSFNLPCFRVIYLFSEAHSSLPASRVLISVPKRYFKRAVKRNLLKRRIREAYRRNKNELIDAMVQQNKRIDFAIVWTSDKVATYEEITDYLRLAVKRLLLKKRADGC